MSRRPRRPPARAGAREWAALAVLGVPAVLVMMNMSVLYLALPRLSSDLEPDGAELLWIMDVYGFTVAGFLITMGALGDRLGHRRVLLLGAAAFAGASVLAAYSTGAGALIAARAVQGVAAAAMAPSSLGVIRGLFTHPAQRARAITIWTMAFMGGGALGPIVGGALLQYFRWGSVFLVSVPAMVVLLVCAPFLVPPSRGSGAGLPDPASVVMSLAAPLTLVYGVKGLASDGPGTASLGSVAAGLLIGAAFVRRQRRLSAPLVDPALFRNPAFAVPVAGMTVVGALLFGTTLLTSQYLQLVVGLEPLAAGLWQAPTAVVGTLTALVASGLVPRVHPAVPMGAGAALAVAGPVLFVLADGGPGLVVAGSVALFAGLSPFMALGTGLVVGAAPRERSGAASAISETGAELGGALGIAVLGGVATAVYGARVRDRMPEGVPGDLARSAGETLPAALTAAERLPGDLGGALVETARSAFVHSLHVHALVLVPLLAVLAVVTLTVLRREPEPAPPQGRDTAPGTVGD
ncbi:MULTISPECIES: MFS transporter [unclassified Nocardiopsis]|uniref:MFS transporter n=1 Tax=Nocardiopsis TaxID=2013 RepID=UPI00387B13A7